METGKQFSLAMCFLLVTYIHTRWHENIAAVVTPSDVTLEKTNDGWRVADVKEDES